MMFFVFFFPITGQLMFQKTYLFARGTEYNDPLVYKEKSCSQLIQSHHLYSTGNAFLELMRNVPWGSP